MMAYKFSNKKDINPLEPPCRKTIYNSAEDAQDMVRFINENRNVQGIKAYRCTICGFWHLTSKSK